MRAVNLLPKNAYAPKQRLPHAKVVLAATTPVLAGALVFLGYSFAHAHLVDKQSQLGDIQSQVAALGPSQQEVADASQVTSLRGSREAALQSVLASRLAWDVLLPQVAAVTPPGTWFTSLTAQAPTAGASTSTSSTTTSGTGLSLSGYAPSQEAVAQLLERLALVPGVSGVTLGSSLATTLGASKVVQFDVSAALAGSGA
jgi:Tfp pilus assembly protein PilN